MNLPKKLEQHHPLVDETKTVLANIKIRRINRLRLATVNKLNSTLRLAPPNSPLERGVWIRLIIFDVFGAHSALQHFACRTRILINLYHRHPPFRADSISRRNNYAMLDASCYLLIGQARFPILSMRGSHYPNLSSSMGEICLGDTGCR